jgi:hypothetical protein
MILASKLILCLKGWRLLGGLDTNLITQPWLELV